MAGVLDFKPRTAFSTIRNNLLLEATEKLAICEVVASTSSAARDPAKMTELVQSLLLPYLKKPSNMKTSPKDLRETVLSIKADLEAFKNAKQHTTKS